ncbi:hypothetical protein NL108_004196 [Boleophthalmus pectinirostris]|uniref:tripartite motif-containing protein 16-like n=1 Tax=Boleophthalmus pectinirostris TaxID=150288 RepID=UPI00242BB1A5|nr:tripartite motif-containing protein 16-like [Boleophthalmus pectinirostris]KAJ0069336.1 hypothetical protein NL108_004196 [Boleophthalmus pectinirostris]
MASKNEERFTCSICLQLMVDPVTIGCGHSYCMKCINVYWDKKFAEGAACSCPQCRQTFTPRPALFRNALLAELVEEHNKTVEADAADGDVDEPGGVLCDICTGKKRSACKFCLTCLVSYCQIHLNPHLEIGPLKKHNLVQASENNKQVICVRHHKLLELYCRTERLFICALCVVEGHQSHDTVAVTEEMNAVQEQIEKNKDQIRDRVMDSEKKMTELEEAAKSIKGTAWEVCDEFERVCQENIRLYVTAMEKKCADVRERVGEAEKAGLHWTNSLLGKLRSEVNVLKRKDEELTQILQTEEPMQFIQGFQAIWVLPAKTNVHTNTEKLPEFVKNQKQKLKNICNTEMEELWKNLTQYSALSVPKAKDITTLKHYLVTKYKNHKLEIDPNTVASCLSLSSSNRELSWGGKDQGHPDHKDRFTYFPQALCKQGFKTNTYWEVEWDGGVVEVAVSYKGIRRKGSGSDCCFGHNNLSWKLICGSSGCKFWYNKLERAPIPPVRSRKIAVHLEYKEGILSFYSINANDELGLLHKTQVVFTEPVYPGFSVDLGSTLKIRTI